MPDLLTNLTNAEYHAHPAMSNSRLKRFIDCPRTMDDPVEETDAMAWGTLVHTILLEPSEFTSRVVIKPADAPKRPDSRQLNAKKPSDETIAAIAWWDRFNAETAGKRIISAETATNLEALVERIQADPIAGPLLADLGRVEQSFFWDDAETGIPMRCRPDAWGTDNIIRDVKTCANCAPYEFGRAALELGYDRQAAIYTDGVEAVTGTRPDGFVFIAIEGKERGKFYIQCHSVEADVMEAGHKRYRQGLRDYKAMVAERGTSAAAYPYAVSASIKPLRVPYHYLND